MIDVDKFGDNGCLIQTQKPLNFGFYHQRLSSRVFVSHKIFFFLLLFPILTKQWHGGAGKQKLNTLSLVDIHRFNYYTDGWLLAWPTNHHNSKGTIRFENSDFHSETWKLKVLLKITSSCMDGRIFSTPTKLRVLVQNWVQRVHSIQ